MILSGLKTWLETGELLTTPGLADVQLTLSVLPGGCLRKKTHLGRRRLAKPVKCSYNGTARRQGVSFSVGVGRLGPSTGRRHGQPGGLPSGIFGRMIEANPEDAVAFGLFSVRQAKAAGYRESEIRSWVSRGRWIQAGRGLLVEAGCESRPEDQVVRDVLEGGPHAVAGFASAARVHGWDLDALPATPAVILPPGVNGRGRVSSYRALLQPDEMGLAGVLRLTTPLHTAVQLACVLPMGQAVVLLDSAMRSRQVRPDRLAGAIAGSRAVGSKSAREALALADPLSGSIPESLARLLFHEAGLPAPNSQYWPRLNGMSARVDFAWPEFMLVVEIDGRKYHIDAVAFQRDRVRQNALMQGKWMVLRFTVEDVRYDRLTSSTRFDAHSHASARYCPDRRRTGRRCSSGIPRPPATTPCWRRLPRRRSRTAGCSCRWDPRSARRSAAAPGESGR